MYRAIPGMGKQIHKAFMDGCIDGKYYAGNDEMIAQCAGNAGVYRPTFVSFLFFALSAVAVRFQPEQNRLAWPAKYGVYLILVVISMFLPNAPLFTGFFLVVARIGAAVFILLQQIILIDVAYNWNERWLEKSQDCDREEFGSGVTWLRAILGTCLLFYSLALTGIILLFQHFGGCPENNAVISLTLIGIVAVTALQLSGTEGSLLTSSVISLYVVYLAFSVVSKNPHAVCNPRLGQNDITGIIVGMFLTAVSLAWTGWSFTAEERLNADGVQTTRSVQPSASSRPTNVDLDVPFLDPEDAPTSGIVVESARAPVVPADEAADGAIPGGAHLWKLNVVLCLVSCWVAASLTGWGTVEGGLATGGATAANPQAGRVNMAMIAISQWCAILLYSWTLLAPRLFPDRDFS